MRVKRKRYRYILVICFNVILFYLLYLWLQKNIKLHSLLFDVEHTSSAAIFFILLFYVFIMVIYGFRFALLLKSDFKKAFSIIGIGSGINNILPFRVGDVLRVYFAKRFYNFDMPHTLAATFIERYFDLIMLLVFGAIILLTHQFGLEVNAVYMFIILLSCSVLSIFLYRYLIVENSYLKQLVCRSERVKRLLAAVEDVASTPNKFPVLICSAFIWSAVLLVYYLFFKWNLPHGSFGWGGAVFLLFTTTLSFAIPYAFASVGIFEAAIVYYLIKYLHIIPAKALALALVFHFVSAVPQIVIMLAIFIIHRSYWLKSARKAKVSY